MMPDFFPYDPDDPSDRDEQVRQSGITHFADDATLARIAELEAGIADNLLEDIEISQLRQRIAELESDLAIETANGNHWAAKYSKWVQTDESAKKLIEQGDRIAELEAKLEVSPDTSFDGIDARNETIRLQDLKIAELKRELAAERERADYAWRNTNTIEKARQELEAEIAEQCRLLGMSGSREAKLLAEIDALRGKLKVAETMVRGGDRRH